METIIAAIISAAAAIIVCVITNKAQHDIKDLKGYHKPTPVN